MKHNRLIAASLLFVLSLVPLWAEEADAQAEPDPAPVELSEYVRALLNNRYMLENIRLIAIAEQHYGQGRYNQAEEIARQAMRYAQLSDDYVALQLRIRETHEAIDSAESRIAWARRMGAPTRHTAAYERAQSTFADALDARDGENWNSALAHAHRVIDILTEVTTVLPARFLVRTWEGTRDCLWNIAALPEIYGDGSRWPILYRANTGRMPQPGNPHLIRPGMILEIPSIAGEIRYGIMEE